MIVYNLDAQNIKTHNIFQPPFETEILKKSTIASNNISNNVIIKGDTHSFIRIPNNRFNDVKELLESELSFMDIMRRPETEKEISRLDKDISEIKNNIVKINERMDTFVTKEYLNNEFRKSLASDIENKFNNKLSSQNKWFIATILIPVVLALLNFLFSKYN